jgi:hypothetical protein
VTAMNDPPEISRNPDAYRATMDDQLVLIEALHAIATSTDDADTLRIAFAALSNTVTGRNYLAANPLRY